MPHVSSCPHFGVLKALPELIKLRPYHNRQLFFFYPFNLDHYRKEQLHCTFFFLYYFL